METGLKHEDNPYVLSGTEMLAPMTITLRSQSVFLSITQFSTECCTGNGAQRAVPYRGAQQEEKACSSRAEPLEH